MASTETVSFSGKAMFLGFICFHVITYDFIEADGQWEKFVLHYHSDKKVLAAFRCTESAHSTDNLSRIYYIFLGLLCSIFRVDSPTSEFQTPKNNSPPPKKYNVQNTAKV